MCDLPPHRYNGYVDRYHNHRRNRSQSRDRHDRRRNRSQSRDRHHTRCRSRSRSRDRHQYKPTIIISAGTRQKQNDDRVKQASNSSSSNSFKNHVVLEGCVGNLKPKKNSGFYTRKVIKNGKEVSLVIPIRNAVYK